MHLAHPRERTLPAHQREGSGVLGRYNSHRKRRSGIEMDVALRKRTGKFSTRIKSGFVRRRGQPKAPALRPIYRGRPTDYGYTIIRSNKGATP